MIGSEIIDAITDRKLSEDTVVFDGKECYLVTGKLSAKKGGAFINGFGMTDQMIDDSGMLEGNMDVEFYFDKKTKDLIGAKYDAKEVMNAAMKLSLQTTLSALMGSQEDLSEYVKVEVDEFQIMIHNIEYNVGLKLTLPAAAQNAHYASEEPETDTQPPIQTPDETDQYLGNYLVLTPDFVVLMDGND